VGASIPDVVCYLARYAEWLQAKAATDPVQLATAQSVVIGVWTVLRSHYFPLMIFAAVEAVLLANQIRDLRRLYHHGTEWWFHWLLLELG
jgi:hypothetical protein